MMKLLTFYTEIVIFWSLFVLLNHSVRTPSKLLHCDIIKFISPCIIFTLYRFYVYNIEIYNKLCIARIRKFFIYYKNYKSYGKPKKKYF